MSGTEKTVLTVLRSGGIYNEWHVRAIRRQVKQHSPDINFVCLTDFPPIPGVNCAQIHNNWPGWWSKIELFQHCRHGNFLYLDLDLIILKSINHLFADDTTLRMTHDPYYPDHPNSSVMSWCRDLSALAGKFSNNLMENVHRYNIGGYVGDQSFLNDYAPWDFFKHPKQFVSFRGDLEKQKMLPSKDAVIINFHGKNKPWMSKMPAWCHLHYLTEELNGMRKVVRFD